LHNAQKEHVETVGEFHEPCASAWTRNIGTYACMPDARKVPRRNARVFIR
jgi:hypothetical protein